MELINYKPITAVWEITMGCNMRCGHCGSSCHDPLPDELTTEEALKVCDDMKTLGMKWITLSGGEPLTRKDWFLLAGRLYKNGIIPNIITNGWLLTEEIVKTAEDNGVATISISLDGVKSTHDTIRRPGSYERVIQAFQILHKMNHISGANTTVTEQNIRELDEIKNILIANGVNLWQIQIGLPMGNLASKKELIIKPEIIDYLLEYSYKTTAEGRIKVFPADCLGYFTSKEMLVRQISTGSVTPVIWQGCNAGKRSFGLLHNGDVLGCASIREQSFIEGNIRERSLVEIWNDPNSFAWARSLKKSDLSGNCKQCCYGDVCLGGCPNTRQTLYGSIYSDNAYCSHHYAMEKTKTILNKYNDPKQLLALAVKYAQENKWQLAVLTLERGLQIDPQNLDMLAYYGYASYQIGNFETAKEANQAILSKDPDNVYALKGMGLTLHKLQESQKGIENLLRATQLATSKDMDSFYDLSIVYYELGRYHDALETLEKANKKSPAFIAQVRPYYEMLNQLERNLP